MTIELPLALIAILVPICMGLTSLAKMYVGSRWSPLAALVIGIGLALAAVPDMGYGMLFIVGSVIGLSAAGLYSGVKATINPAADDTTTTYRPSL